jgi:hypothetical protein
MRTLSRIITRVFLLFHLTSKAQTDVLRDRRVGLVLKQVAAKRPGLHMEQMVRNCQKKILMRNKNYYIIPWLLLGFSLSYCYSDNNIVIKGFNQTAWQKDSLGCIGVRENMGRILQSNMKVLTGHSSLELKAFLGPPNIIHKRGSVAVYTYFLEPGRQCHDKNWKEKGYTECLQILFFIENDKIKVTDLIYP